MSEERSRARAPGLASEWIRGRDGDSPAGLRASVRRAVERHEQSGASVSDPARALAEAAIECLAQALRMGSDRAAAAPLLAADALLAYAVEAAAEQGASLDDLAAAVDRRLATLLAS